MQMLPQLLALLRRVIKSVLLNHHSQQVFCRGAVPLGANINIILLVI